MAQAKSQIDEASRRHQLQKQLRKKKYQDIQIQGTNNSSIASKRSVEQIYTTKLNPELGEWFKYFVPKPKRRSPAINRGYWLRMEAIRLLVQKIIEHLPHQEVVVINLGCGFDPLPFQLLNMKKEKPGSIKQSLAFCDFDYPELVDRKKNMINDSDEIKQIIGDQIPSQDKDCVLQTSTYKLLGCDLKDANRFSGQIDKYLGDTKQTKIFIAEVSLAYVRAEFANPVIEVASKLEDSHMLILEQLLPLGPYHPFAKKMLYHFDHLGSPIHCIETYPKEEDQIARFQDYFKHVELRDLWKVWNEIISDELKKLVSQIEEFDEWEEFIMFCQHYFVLHALTETVPIYSHPKIQLVHGAVADNDNSHTLCWNKLKLVTELQLKFPAVAPLGDKLLVHGGLDQTRNDKTYLVDLATGNSKNVPDNCESPLAAISSRMCHLLVSLSTDQILLTGGRSRPGLSYCDVYKLTKQENGIIKSTRLTDMTAPRWRHAAVAVLDIRVLLFGGLEEDNGDVFQIYDVERELLVNVVVKGDTIPNLFSCGICFNRETGKGYIVGGIENNVTAETNGSMYEFTLDNSDINNDNNNNDIAIIVTKVIENEPLLARVGCQMEFMGPNNLVIIGGVNYHGLLTRNNTIVSINTDTSRMNIKPISMSENIWGKESPTPIFIGFSLLKVQTDPKAEQLVVFGGGAVCYAFGSCCNSEMLLIKTEK